MRRLLPTVFAVPVAFLAACADDGAIARATIRDSAGVAIVENGALPPLDTSSWRLEPEPSLTIGVVEGEEAYQFQYIRAVTRLSDGRIAVADGSSQIRYFDADGTHLKSVGREGDGPGEFRFIDDVFRLPGDSLLVVSGDRGAVYSLISPAGEFVGLFATVASFARAQARLSDGRLLHLRYAGSVAPATVGHVQDSVLVVVEDLRGAVASSAESGSTDVGANTTLQLDPASIAADTIVRIPGNDEFRQAFGNGIANSPVPFGRHIETAMQGDRVVVGVGNEGMVQVHEPDGRLVRSIRFTAAREPLAGPEIDAWKEWRLSMVRNPDQQRLVEDYIDAMTFPTQRPVSGSIVVDADGWIWLERYRVDAGYYVPVDDAPRLWYVLDPEGRAVATVETPPHFQVHEIGRDYVLGVARDELGVESVRLYTLRRGPR